MRVIQICGDPGIEMQYLYDTGEVWRWYWKETPTGAETSTHYFVKTERVWERLELPQ